MIAVRSLIRRRGTGYIVDRRDERDMSLDTLGLSAATTETYSLRPHAGPILQQGGSNSCVANAVLDAEVTCQKARYGRDVELGSRLAAYYLGRAAHGAERVDQGTYIRLCIKQIARFGICPERHWPFQLTKINRQPPFRVFTQAYDRRGIRGYFRLEHEGEARHAAIRAAVESGRPVVFGVQVDKAFTQDAGPDHIEYPSRLVSIGGHAMQLLGFKPGWFQIKQTWGTGWRDRGYAWLAEGWINAASDLWLVDPVG